MGNKLTGRCDKDCFDPDDKEVATKDRFERSEVFKHIKRGGFPL